MHPLTLDLTSPPAIEPVTVDEVAAQARIDADEATLDNDLIAAYIAAARQHCETYCDRAFISQTYEMILASFPFGGGYFNRAIRNNPTLDSFLPTHAGAIAIPRPPCQTIVSIAYLDPQANSHTLDPSAYRLVKGSASATQLLPRPNGLWPITFPVPGSVTITFIAGYGDTADSVPAGIKLAIRMLAATWYAQREAFSEGTLAPIPYGIETLLSPFVWGAY